MSIEEMENVGEVEIAAPDVSDVIDALKAIEKARDAVDELRGPA